MAKTAQDYALKGYCLWLVPDGAPEASLQTLVKDLAALESAPVFFPHITLLSPKNAIRDSAADMEDAVRRAIAATSRPPGPMQLTLEAPAPGTFYYQCVLAPVAASDELAALRTATEAACGEHPKFFFPHLSLLYGDLSDERKAQLCAEAAHRVVFPLKITVTHAVVVDVNGTAPDWKIVARVPL